MLISIILILLLTFAGLTVTYFLDREETLLWRAAVGNVVGTCIFGTVAFVMGCFTGLATGAVIASLLITLLPALLLLHRRTREAFADDFQRARGQLSNANPGRISGFLYYAFFLILFWAFFSKAMWEAKDGIYTGGSQNLGDLPFHLGAIFSFTDGANFPPQNPSWAGARFSYPFVADLVTACFAKLGANVPGAIGAQDASWAMSLLIILERFVAKLTGSKLAGRIAPPLLFFSGGLGFLSFLVHWWSGDVSLSHLTNDFTITDVYRWGNSMVVLFVTQRSLLLGMPLTLVVLGGLWKIFAGQISGSDEKKDLVPATPLVALVLGVLAGMLPLVHLHSLGALFVVTAFCFALRPGKWREWLLFGAGVCIIALPELLWSMSGTASETKSFFGLNWGWDKGSDTNIIYFWLTNTGLTIPLIFAGLWLLFRERDGAAGSEDRAHRPQRMALIQFYIPFAFLFALCNVFKFAPWEWDNIKLLIYWFVGSLPLMTYFLVWLWGSKSVLRAAAVATFIALIFAGALDVYRTASGQINTRVIDADGVKIGNAIRDVTGPHAIILNNPTYNSPVVLSGRISLMRYPGHLSSHGIDYTGRERDVKAIYSGGGVADVLLRKYNVDYVLVGPEERSTLQANESFFSQYPLAAQAGQYKLYKVK